MDSLFKTLKDTSHESIEGTTLNMDDFVDIYNGLALNFLRLYSWTGYHLSGSKSEPWQKPLLSHLEERKSLNLKFR